MRMLDGFTLPDPDWPTPSECDVCGQECTSECLLCGESYCSRKCLAAVWKDHRRVCETVYENDCLGPMLTQMEMNERLSSEAMERVFGSKHLPELTRVVLHSLNNKQMNGEM